MWGANRPELIISSAPAARARENQPCQSMYGIPGHKNWQDNGFDEDLKRIMGDF
jgi:hypothetical protein